VLVLEVMQGVDDSNGSFRAAVALNNMGVHFLERGSFSQALVTLKDSVAVLKALFNSDQAKVENLVQFPRDDQVLRKLKRAVQRSSEPTALSQIAKASSRTQVLEIKVVSHNAYNHPNPSIWSPQTLCPVRIETFDEDSDFGIETAIAIYNCGIANLCMSCDCLDQGLADVLKNDSLRLFRLSSCVLNHYSSLHEDDGAQFVGFLCLYVTVMERIVYVLAEQNNVMHALEASEKLHVLKALINDYDGLFFFSGVVSSMASAA
jgi:hypothetical protein